MDSSELRKTHERFLATARGAAARAGGDGQRTNAQIVAHIVATDRLLAQTIALVIGGRPAVYDGTILDVPSYVNAIVGSAPTYLGLIGIADRASDELCALLRAMTKEHERVLVRTRIVDAGRVIRDDDVPLIELIETHVRTHIATHASEVASARSPVPARR